MINLKKFEYFERENKYILKLDKNKSIILLFIQSRRVHQTTMYGQ